MALAVPLFLILLALGAALAVAFFWSAKAGAAAASSGDAVRAEAARRLARDPSDTQALLSLAELAFEERSYADAARYYGALVGLCPTHPELDEFALTLRHGIAALESGDLEGSSRSLLAARAMRPGDFQANHHLGVLELRRGRPGKAAAYLQIAWKAEPERVETARLLGETLYSSGRYSEAFAPLASAAAWSPDDAETALALAHCRLEMGQREEALASFTQLRTDPKVGARAALYAGTIHLNAGRVREAAENFELGLRHTEVPQTAAKELRYRLALAWLRDGRVEPAVELLTELASADPGFRDVKELLARYGRVAADRALQAYMLAPIGEFASLARRLATVVFVPGRAKIVEVSERKSDWVDVVAQITTAKWDDVVLLRFLRAPGAVGELVLREMHARMKELRAARGVCCNPAGFSDTAQKFVEARLIDLVDETQLNRLFDRLRLQGQGGRSEPSP